jgi:hypothetical protein
VCPRLAAVLEPSDTCFSSHWSASTCPALLGNSMRIYFTNPAFNWLYLADVPTLQMILIVWDVHTQILPVKCCSP